MCALRPPLRRPSQGHAIFLGSHEPSARIWYPEETAPAKYVAPYFCIYV